MFLTSLVENYEFVNFGLQKIRHTSLGYNDHRQVSFDRKNHVLEKYR